MTHTEQTAAYYAAGFDCSQAAAEIAEQLLAERKREI